ncbi:hypothetical protein KIPB_005438, partial [Kipferlia bialata]
STSVPSSVSAYQRVVSPSHHGSGSQAPLPVMPSPGQSGRQSPERPLLDDIYRPDESYAPMYMGQPPLGPYSPASAPSRPNDAPMPRPSYPTGEERYEDKVWGGDPEREREVQRTPGNGYSRKTETDHERELRVRNMTKSGQYGVHPDPHNSVRPGASPIKRPVVQSSKTCLSIINSVLKDRQVEIPQTIASLLRIETANPRFIQAQETYVFTWLEKFYPDVLVDLPSEWLPTHVRAQQRRCADERERVTANRLLHMVDRETLPPRPEDRAPATLGGVSLDHPMQAQDTYSQGQSISYTPEQFSRSHDSKGASQSGTRSQRDKERRKRSRERDRAFKQQQETESQSDRPISASLGLHGISPIGSGMYIPQVNEDPMEAFTRSLSRVPPPVLPSYVPSTLEPVPANPSMSMDRVIDMDPGLSMPPPAPPTRAPHPLSRQSNPVDPSQESAAPEAVQTERPPVLDVLPNYDSPATMVTPSMPDGSNVTPAFSPGVSAPLSPHAASTERERERDSGTVVEGEVPGARRE